MIIDELEQRLIACAVVWISSLITLGVLEWGGCALLCCVSDTVLSAGSVGSSFILFLGLFLTSCARYIVSGWDQTTVHFLQRNVIRKNPHLWSNYDLKEHEMQGQ